VRTDREVVADSLREPQAFGELYLQHARVVQRSAWRRAEEMVADEVISDTFLKAFEVRSRFDTTMDDARPWLLGIATRVLHNHLRSEGCRLTAFTRIAGWRRHS
jgi:DNA-directed RNA polymerase specialized sigma24 family protein